MPASTPTGPAVNEAAPFDPGNDRQSAAALARYYDLDVAKEQNALARYLALAAATGGPILELACGSGRLCVPLAGAGHRVVGIDRDTAMLERATRAWQAIEAATAGGELELVQADITDLHIDRRFTLVILAFNGLLLLDEREAQKNALGVIAEHLADDGRAVIDAWLPTPDDLALYDGRTILEWVRHDDDGEEWVAKTTAARYLSASHSAVVDTFFDAWRQGEPTRRTHRRDRVSFIGVTELLALTDDAGLEPVVVAGDYDMSQLEDASERVVLVCRARRPGLL